MDGVYGDLGSRALVKGGRTSFHVIPSNQQSAGDVTRCRRSRKSPRWAAWASSWAWAWTWSWNIEVMCRASRKAVAGPGVGSQRLGSAARVVSALRPHGEGRAFGIGDGNMRACWMFISVFVQGGNRFGEAEDARMLGCWDAKIGWMRHAGVILGSHMRMMVTTMMMMMMLKMVVVSERRRPSCPRPARHGELGHG